MLLPIPSRVKQKERIILSNLIAFFVLIAGLILLVGAGFHFASADWLNAIKYMVSGTILILLICFFCYLLGRTCPKQHSNIPEHLEEAEYQAERTIG